MGDWNERIRGAHAILERAHAMWNPVATVCLFSGGYDSMVATHVTYRWKPSPVWSIDTCLSADGWTDYVQSVARQLQWDHHIYVNHHGYDEFVTFVRYHGAPRGIHGHTYTYIRLKERAIYRILANYKQDIHDKVLFITGIRRDESPRRAAMAKDIQRNHTSNIIFVNPIVDWTGVDVTRYRWDYDLPDNPFYATVKGSGDCQCNWGNFITVERLKRFSPVLWRERVQVIDRISGEYHGYGWDGVVDGQLSLFSDNDEDHGSDHLGLCSQCSRAKGDVVAAFEYRMLQDDPL